MNPNHQKGTAKSGAFSPNRSFKDNAETKNLQAKKTTNGKIYQNKTAGPNPDIQTNPF